MMCEQAPMDSSEGFQGLALAYGPALGPDVQGVDGPLMTQGSALGSDSRLARSPTHSSSRAMVYDHALRLDVQCFALG